MREFGARGVDTLPLDTSLVWTLVCGHDFDVKLPGAVAEESSCTPSTLCAPATTAAGPNLALCGLCACSNAELLARV